MLIVEINRPGGTLWTEPVNAALAGVIVLINRRAFGGCGATCHEPLASLQRRLVADVEAGRLKADRIRLRLGRCSNPGCTCGHGEDVEVLVATSPGIAPAALAPVAIAMTPEHSGEQPAAVAQLKLTPVVGGFPLLDAEPADLNAGGTAAKAAAIDLDDQWEPAPGAYLSRETPADRSPPAGDVPAWLRAVGAVAWLVGYVVARVERAFLVFLGGGVA